MKKLLSQIYNVGQIISVEMHKPSKGVFPIARANNGVICIIAPGTKGYFEYNSTWTAEIVEIHEKKMLIKPIECTMTAAANEFEFKKKAQQAFGAKIIKVKKEKPKYNYQFNRAS